MARDLPPPLGVYEVSFVMIGSLAKNHRPRITFLFVSHSFDGNSAFVRHDRFVEFDYWDSDLCSH